MMNSRIALVNASMSKEPSSLRNFKRFSEARLQAESSTNIYSLHGFEALIGPEFGHVCQRFIVLWYWTPGSPQILVPSAVNSINSRAECSPIFSPVVTAYVAHTSSFSTHCINSSVTRTERLEFWNITLLYASLL